MIFCASPDNMGRAASYRTVLEEPRAGVPDNPRSWLMDLRHLRAIFPEMRAEVQKWRCLASNPAQYTDGVCCDLCGMGYTWGTTEAGTHAAGCPAEPMEALGNGTGCSPEASVEFMGGIPAEVDGQRELIKEALKELRPLLEVKNEDGLIYYCSWCARSPHTDACIITRLERALGAAAGSVNGMKEAKKRIKELEILVEEQRACLSTYAQPGDPDYPTRDDVGACDNEAVPPCTQDGCDDEGLPPDDEDEGDCTGDCGGCDDEECSSHPAHDKDKDGQ